jgi:SPP1 family phage portal protein
MDEEIKLLIEKLKSDPENAVKDFEKTKKINTEDYILEYEGGRDLRPTQINELQKDKTIGTGANEKLVRKAKLKVQFQKKITRTATAFEVGEDVTLKPNDSKFKLHDEIIAVWRNNRIDSKLKELIKLKKSHTEAALLFYLSPITPEDLIGKFLGALGIAQKNEIKTRVISNKNGTMYPYFDSSGNMIAFGYGFNTKIVDKEVKNLWVYTSDKLIKLDNTTGAFEITESKIHGFSKIPIVYISQEQPEWFDVIELIDRYEVALSKQSDSNDYTAHPILITEGQIKGAPDKNETGKVFNIPIKYDDEGREQKGNIRYLTYEQAPEAVKLELETLDDNIHAITSTPNISFNNVKGIGAVSGISLKLMFLDAILKAKDNEGENRTMCERIINIMISGTIKSVNTSLANEANQLIYEIQFNSILPDDLKTASDVVKTLRDAGVISKKTAIQYLQMVQDTEKEIEEINAEETAKNDITNPPNTI